MRVRERLNQFITAHTRLPNRDGIYSVGTQVVAQKDVMASNNRVAHPAGAVGVIVRSPVDRTHAYRVKFGDGFEAPTHHDQLVQLSELKSNSNRAKDALLMSSGLYERVIYRCVIGSRAYGLDEEDSDTLVNSMRSLADASGYQWLDKPLTASAM